MVHVSMDATITFFEQLNPIPGRKAEPATHRRRLETGLYPHYNRGVASDRQRIHAGARIASGPTVVDCRAEKGRR
jgi:hypothetical protein